MPSFNWYFHVLNWSFLTFLFWLFELTLKLSNKYINILHTILLFIQFSWIIMDYLRLSQFIISIWSTCLKRFLKWLIYRLLMYINVVLKEAKFSSMVHIWSVVFPCVHTDIHVFTCTNTLDWISVFHSMTLARYTASMVLIAYLNMHNHSDNDSARPNFGCVAHM